MIFCHFINKIIVNSNTRREMISDTELSCFLVTLDIFFWISVEKWWLRSENFFLPLKVIVSFLSMYQLIWPTNFLPNHCHGCWFIDIIATINAIIQFHCYLNVIEQSIQNNHNSRREVEKHKLSYEGTFPSIKRCFESGICHFVDLNEYNMWYRGFIPILDF